MIAIKRILPYPFDITEIKIMNQTMHWAANQAEVQLILSFGSLKKLKKTNMQLVSN